MLKKKVNSPRSVSRSISKSISKYRQSRSIGRYNSPKSTSRNSFSLKSNYSPRSVSSNNSYRSINSGVSKKKYKEPNDNENNDNIFDLTKSIPKNREREIETIKTNTAVTQSEQKELLNGYIEVSQHNWSGIPIQSHIRYMRNDGVFMKGGHIRSHYISNKGPNTGKPYFYMIASLNYRGKGWYLYHHTIPTVWVRKEKKFIEGSNLEKMNESFSKVKESLKNNRENHEFVIKRLNTLHSEIKRVDNDQKRILALIKKLHKINTH